MRILRGKSNRDVSAKGFAWFVVGMVIATFVGGAVRTLLASDQLHQRIVSELRARFPQQQFTLGQTEVLLSHGMWPGLGLRVRQLNFRQDVCGKLSFVLEVPQVDLPVDLLTLMRGRVRLGRIELNDGRLHLDYRPCTPASTSAQAAVTAAPVKKPMIPTPSLDWRRMSEHVRGLTLKHFVLTYERNATWKILAHEVRVDLDDDLWAHGVLEVQKTLPTGHLSHVVDLDAQGDDEHLQWDVRSEFKEGNVHIHGALDLNTRAASVAAVARQLPMRDVMSELHQMGFAARDLQLKSTWLSCTLKWEGMFERPAASPVVAQDCRTEGGYGRVELENAEFWGEHLDQLKRPAILKVSKLQMQPLLEALGREVLPAVLSRPGIWSGELKYLNPDSWSLQGFLEEAEVVFSNRSVRGKQAIEKLRTRVERAQGTIRAVVDDLRIRGGDFAGQLNFALKDDWRNGEFRAEVSKLVFSAPVQQLLAGGRVGALSFNGRGQLSDGELSRWQGDFTLSEVSGPGWELRDLKVNSDFMSGVFRLEGRAPTAFLETTKFAALSSVRKVSERVDWRDLQAKAEIRAGGGLIQSASASEVDGPLWRLKGAWVRDVDFNAALNVGKKAFALTADRAGLQIRERL